MFNIKVLFDSPTILRRFDYANKKLIKNTEIALWAAGLMIQKTAKTEIAQGAPRHGVVYYVGGKRAQRSAPYEYPKTDTGRLVNSIEIARGDLWVTVGSNVNYAKDLELGTSSMQPRPWLIPSAKANRVKIQALFDKARRVSI